MLEIWDCVQVEWEKIDEENCQKLIESVPKKIEGVIKAKGREVDKVLNLYNNLQQIVFKNDL